MVSLKAQGKVGHRTPGSLGERDQLPTEEVDTAVAHLRKLATPEGSGGVRHRGVEVEQVCALASPWWLATSGGSRGQTRSSDETSDGLLRII